MNLPYSIEKPHRVPEQKIPDRMSYVVTDVATEKRKKSTYTITLRFFVG